MKQKVIAIKSIFILLFVFSISANAQSIEEIISGENYENLTKQEVNVLKIVNEWTKGKKVNPVSRGANGEIELIYGLSQPHILTAILQVTDIQFELNETITSVTIGDTARWLVEHISANTSYGIQEHIIIKPKDINLLTSLVVVTNRRTYHIQLKSTNKNYYPMVKFHYPRSIIAKTNQSGTIIKRNNNNTILSPDNTTTLDIDSLSFSYKIKGSAKFKPTRVYNDGSKTIIELPEKTKSGNIPILMTIEPESKKPVIVNYRYINNKFIVDAVFDKAILISGVGMKQKKITIIKE